MASNLLLKFLLVGLFVHWDTAQSLVAVACLRHLEGILLHHHLQKPPPVLIRPLPTTPICWICISPQPRRKQSLQCRGVSAYCSPLSLRGTALKMASSLWRSATMSRLWSTPNGTAADHGMWEEYESPFLRRVDRFVLFGDLHVSDATLSTCLDALELVQQTCKRHTNLLRKNQVDDPSHFIPMGLKNKQEFQEAPAVAVFLGDFWHSRVERQLHWGLLRPLLEFWEQWDVPTILLPGNHDQLHYDTGRDLLQPLERAVSQSKFVLALRRPTLVNKELLFLPHIRCNAKLQRILLHAKQCKTLRAVFGHLSIRGAVVSASSEEGGNTLNEGVELDVLPDVPVYSGHIHTPQLVGERARYVGSLYQTSLGEAYQRKRLYTISRASDFNVVEAQESAVGPRHFPVQDTLLLPPPELLRRGDRVLLLPKTATTQVVSPSEMLSPPASSQDYGSHPPAVGTPVATEGIVMDPFRACTSAEGVAPDSLSGHNTHSNKNNSSSSSTGPEGRLSRLNGMNGEKVLKGENTLDADELLRLSAAYKRAGVLFECHVTPVPSVSVPFQQEEPTGNTNVRQAAMPPGAAVPDSAVSAVTPLRSTAAEAAFVSLERPLPVQPSGGDVFPSAPFGRLMHQGFLPLERHRPQDALRLYAGQAAQKHRCVASALTLAAAEGLLQEQLEGAEVAGVDSNLKSSSASAVPNTSWACKAVDLALREARIESFGLYSGVVRFDLCHRGLVFLEGCVEDSPHGSLLAANGTGKSTVMQAVLWGLVGDNASSGFSTSPGRAKVTGVVCDDIPLFPGSEFLRQAVSEPQGAGGEAPDGDAENVGSQTLLHSSLSAADRFASVELEGELNGESFLLRRRRWRSGRCELALHVGGQNFTGQSTVDTQRELESFFEGRLKAWSQFLYLSAHGADGLLRTSETSFSAILTLLLPLNVWTAAAASARSQQRALGKAADTLDLVAAIRARDLQRLVARQTHRGVGALPDSPPATSSATNAGGDPQLQETRRLQRLTSLLRSRAAFHRSKQSVLAAAEELLGPQGIQRHLLASALRQLEAQTNIYLDAVSDGMLRLDFAPSKTSRMNKVLSVRGSDGAFRERTLQQASSGQRQLLGLCLFLALIVTIKRRTGLRCNALFLDEPFLSLDAGNTHRMLSLLRSLVSKPQGAQLAEFESMFVAQHGLDSRRLQLFLDAVDTIGVHSESGHRSIRTAAFSEQATRPL